MQGGPTQKHVPGVDGTFPLAHLLFTSSSSGRSLWRWRRIEVDAAVKHPDIAQGDGGQRSEQVDDFVYLCMAGCIHVQQ